MQRGALNAICDDAVLLDLASSFLTSVFILMLLLTSSPFGVSTTSASPWEANSSSFGGPTDFAMPAVESKLVTVLLAEPDCYANFFTLYGCSVHEKMRTCGDAKY